MKNLLIAMIFVLSGFGLAYSGGNDECVVSTDCIFIWHVIDYADHVNPYTGSLASTGSADVNFKWFYEDDDTSTDLADANEVDESTACSGEIPASGMCLETIDSAIGMYAIYVDSLLLSESGKEFCVYPVDGYAARTFDMFPVCKYVSVAAKHDASIASRSTFNASTDTVIVGSMNEGSLTLAAKCAIKATVDTGACSATATNFCSDRTDPDDTFNGGVEAFITGLTGSNQYSGAAVQDFANTNGQFTLTPPGLPEAPSNGDEFCIIVY